MNTMDYVLIGGALLFAIIGIWKGGAKIFFGFFMLLIIMVGAAFISASVTPLFLTKNTAEGVEYTAPAQAIMSPVGGMLPSGEEYEALLDTNIVLGEDGVLYVGADADVPVKNVVSENVPVVGPYLASFIEMSAEPGTTLRTSISYTAARFAYEIVIWVVVVIILAIIRNVIRKKIFHWLDDKNHATMSKIDRIIGLFVNVAIFVALMWGFGAVVARFDDGSNWAYSLDNMFFAGMISKPFMTMNPLLKLLGIALPASGTV